MKKIIYISSFFIILIAPFLGDFVINYSNIFNESSQDYMVFWDLRVPRVFLAFFCGSILSLSGLIFQTIFKNALITPYTLGVASGSTLFTALFIIFLPSYIYVLGGFLGAFFTILLLFFIANRINKNSIMAQTNSFLLVGIALSFFYSACLMLLFTVSNFEENYSIVRYTLGSLDIVGFAYVFPVAFASLVLLKMVYVYKKEITLMLTSNENAFLKGVEVKKTNFILLLLVSFCVGVCISFTGPIGFIGLVVPHIIKIVYKKSAYKLFWPVFFFGGVFLVLCDIISRNLVQSSTLPIGVVTAFIGAPFFIYLIVRRSYK
ncbi:MAG: iron ABC transporter permease [Arcobacteraceae bacterium]